MTMHQNPEFPAPFVSSVMLVEPQWIDYNGHLNLAYYNVLFDRAVDELYELVGLGPDYLKQHKFTTMVAEAHVRYLRELNESDPVRVSVLVLGYDEKRIHTFEEMRHATEGWLSATSENMTLSIDMTAKKVAPFPQFVTEGLAKLQRAHDTAPRPEGIGRSVAMPKQQQKK